MYIYICICIYIYIFTYYSVDYKIIRWIIAVEWFITQSTFCWKAETSVTSRSPPSRFFFWCPRWLPRGLGPQVTGCRRPIWIKMEPRNNRDYIDIDKQIDKMIDIDIDINVYANIYYIIYIYILYIYIHRCI